MQRNDVRFGSLRRARAAFTLIELLVVLAIIGLLAAIALPKLSGIGKANATLSAERQMLDALAYARQLAIADRSDVYVVFISPNILNLDPAKLDPVSQRVYTNLLTGQYTTYALLSSRRVGDQPGQSQWHYLSDWLSLPDGTFISTNKFMLYNPASYFDITNLVFNNGNPQVLNAMRVYGFNTGTFRFPTEQATNDWILPYIQFNSLGQLTSGRDEYIPLARGSIFYTRLPNGQIDTTKAPDVQENPPHNSLDSMLHDVIQVDPLTGRARAEHTQIQ